nr:MAG: capsid protein [Wenzhou bat dicistrovirus 3]
MDDIQTTSTSDSIPQEAARTHVEEVITFHDQGHRSSDQAIPLIRDLEKSYLDMSIARDKTHEIENFLERPVRIWTGTFSGTDTVATVLWTATFPDVLLSPGVGTMYTQKMSGFVGLRSDLELKVQINAQKFQQGRLRLQYIPYATYMPNKVNSINYTLSGRVACPGVDIDICGGSTPESRIAEATFRIPYVSPHLYYNLVTGEGSFGTFYLFVYSPLQSGTAETTNCQVTVWAKLVEPKLAFPTGADIGSNPYNPTRMKAQVGGEAKQVQTTGVISNTLGQLSTALKTGTNIPVIGKYLAIPEWISSKAASITKLFGFSKPTTAIETKLRTTQCFANFNGKDASHKMALSADNEIDTPPGLSGSSLDEMAISSIVSIPTYWDNFNWTSTTAQDEILWRTPVTPYLIKTIPAGTYNMTTPLGYVAQCFSQWRGSIVYTFKMIKTGFHSGRLRVFYAPYANPTQLTVGSPPSLLIEKNYQRVIDIGESDTFAFSVPFVATKPWLNVDPQINTGFVVVTVLNELRMPSTASNNINVIVEVNAGSDFAFSMPKEPDYLPTQVPPPSKALAEGGKLGEQEGSRMKAQVAGTGVNVERNQSQLLYDPDSISAIDPMANWSPEAHCVGEKIVSIRQLLKRSNPVGVINCDMVGDSRGYGIIAPFGFQVVNSTTNGTKDVDYISYFSQIFAFYRGGMRLKVYAQEAQSGDTNTRLKVDNEPAVWFKMFNAVTILYARIVGNIYKVNNVLGKVNLTNTTPTGFGGSSTLNPAILNATSDLISNQRVEGMHEIEIPYYNSTHISPAVLHYQSDPLVVDPEGQTSENTTPLPLIMFGKPPQLVSRTIGSSSYTTLNTSTYTVYRSAADDFGFYYLIGVPILVVRSVSSSQFSTPSRN